jgi:hypothetical protein
MLARLCNDRSDRLSRPSAVGSTRALMRVVGYKRRVVDKQAEEEAEWWGGGTSGGGPKCREVLAALLALFGWRVSAFIARPLPQKKGERDPRRKSGVSVE